MGRLMHPNYPPLKLKEKKKYIYIRVHQTPHDFENVLISTRPFNKNVLPHNKKIFFKKKIKLVLEH